MIEIFKSVIVISLLILEGIIDFKKREISLTGPIIVSFLAIALLILNPDRSIMEALIGLAEGLVIILFSFASNEAIGYGDGIILCSTGLLLGWRENLIMFFWACLLCALFSIALLILKKADKKTKIAFVPFMAPAFLITIFTYGR